MLAVTGVPQYTGMISHILVDPSAYIYIYVVVPHSICASMVVYAGTVDPDAFNANMVVPNSLYASIVVP